MARNLQILCLMIIMMSFEAQSRTQLVSLVDTTRVDSVRMYRLPEIVVTATRGEKELSEVGRSVTLITSNEIKNTLYNNVAELLSQQAGIYIVGTGQTPGSLQNIFLRGANTNQTVLLIDGIRITDPSSVDNAIDLSELSVSGIEKIEIVRGSHSTMFGSSAIGGGINILSRKGLPPGLHTSAQIEFGTFGSNTFNLTENLFLGYALGQGLYLSGGIFNTRVNGINATIDTVTNPNAYHHPDQDNFAKTDMTGRIGYLNDAFDIYVSYKNSRQKADIDKGAYTDDDNYTIDFKRNLFTYGAAYKMSKDVYLKYLGGYSDMRRVAVDDSSVVDNLGTTDHTYYGGTWKGTTSTNDIQTNVKLKGFEGILGVGYYRETMTSQTYFYSGGSFGVFELRTNLDTLNLNTSTKNIFAHVDLNGTLVHESLGWMACALGLRLNDHNAYGTNFTYEINPSLRIGDHSLLYASYSTGFNAPSLYQLYAPDENYISGITRGNKNLKPETSRSFEIGIRQHLNENLSCSFRAAYFNTVVDNIIDYVYMWEKNKSLSSLSFLDYRGDTYLNLGRQFMSGIEIEVQSQITDKISFVGNVSFIGGKLEYDPRAIDTTHTKGNQIQVFASGAFLQSQTESLGLVRRPATANVILIYKPNEDVVMRLDARYVGQRNDVYHESSLGPFGALASKGIEDYALIDISFKYAFMHDLFALIKIQNLLNACYSEIRGYSTLGRGIFISLNHVL